MKTLTVEVITPERAVWKDAAEYLLIPASKGPMAVLAGHAPFIGRITPGAIRIDARQGARQITVGAGVFEVSPDKVMVIVDSAEIRQAAT